MAAKHPACFSEGIHGDSFVPHAAELLGRTPHICRGQQGCEDT